jgi:hypothetical protein
MGAQDIAVVVSVVGDARPAFSRVQKHLPPLADVLVVEAAGRGLDLRWSCEDASAAAWATMRELRAVLEELRACRAVHLFIAGPAGLAFLLGRLANTLPKVVVYEHVPSGERPYVEGVVVQGVG